MRIVILLLCFAQLSYGQWPFGGSDARSIWRRQIVSTAPTDTQVLCYDLALARIKWCDATAGAGDALTTNPLSQFAATTSAQLKGVISDENGAAAGAKAIFAEGILNIVAAKTFTVNNTLTITATDGITMTTPTTSFTAARTDAANTFTGVQTFANQIITDNLGIEFEESDTNPTCAAGNYNTFADLSETALKMCNNGVAAVIADVPYVDGLIAALPTTLAGTFAALAGSQTFGVSNLFDSSATAGALGLTANDIPSAIASGYWNYDNSGWMGYFNNVQMAYPLVILGAAGRTAPTAPSAGVLHIAGGTFAPTSSLIVAADITAATITPAKMSAATIDAQTDGATITWAIASIKDAFASVTLAGNRTLNITNPVIGGNYVFKITQDGTGTRTLTKGTGCTWLELGSAAATFGLSTTAGDIDVLTFTYDGTNCLASVGKAYGG